MNITREQIDKTIEAYLQLRERAEQLFVIRAQVFGTRYDYITSVNIGPHEIEIETTTYCCGEADHDYCSIPTDYLLLSDDEAKAQFEQAKHVQEEAEKQRHAEYLAKQQREQEERERKEFERLAKKYGGNPL